MFRIDLCGATCVSALLWPMPRQARVAIGKAWSPGVSLAQAIRRLRGRRAKTTRVPRAQCALRLWGAEVCNDLAQTYFEVGKPERAVELFEEPLGGIGCMSRGL